MEPERQSDWQRVRDLAFGLGLSGVEETTSLKQPTQKAHGLVFNVPVEERDILIEAEPQTYFVTPH